MSTNIEKYKIELQNLIKVGENLFKKMRNNEDLARLRRDYEGWYSESSAVIKFLLPDRVSDFSKMYYDDKTKNGIMKHFQYTQNKNESVTWGVDTPPEQIDLAKSILDSQIGILKSCEKRFESSLFDIKQLLQADLFDSELDAARDLNKKGFSRGAGAMAGVVLESHLSEVCWNHKIQKSKAHPTINDFNQLLKDNGVIDTPIWRFIQSLTDLRNLCDHKKQQDPTKEQISELIDGVEQMCKQLY